MTLSRIPVYIKAVIFSLPVAIVLGIWFYLYTDQHQIYPSLAGKTFFFTDAVDNGNSSVISFDEDNKQLELVFELKDGFISPYAGLSITAKEQFWDISAYQDIVIELETSNVKNLEFVFATFQSGVSSETEPNSYRHNIIEIPLYADAKTHTLQLNKMTIAQWWLERNKLSSAELGEPDWTKVSSLSFVAKIRLNEDQNQRLLIKQIYLKRDLTSFYIISGIALCLFYLALYLFSFLKSKDKKITISYEQRTVEDTEGTESKTIDYIAQHYHNSTISLTTIGEALNINEKEISACIKQRFQMTFKEHLNGIRIAEAKRLLSTSSKNISEIAYEVGFNSPNHFNRTFKNIENISPSEYKNSI